jgi:hypothetical protein
MSEQAAAPAAAPATNGAAAPSSSEPARVVHAGSGFEDFQAQIAERMKAQARLDQPPPKPKTVQPQPKPPGEQAPPADPQSQTLETTPQEPADEPEKEEAQQPGQWTQEDIDLLAKAKEWMQSDKMPEEFLKRLVELKNGDEVEYEPWEEVRAGRMRQKDHTRAMQAMDKEREQWTSEKSAYENHFKAIFNDEREGVAGAEAMYEIFTRQGKRRQLMALGEMLAKEEQEDIDAANGMGLALMQRKRIKDHNHHEIREAINKEFENRRKQRELADRQRAMEFENQRLKSEKDQRQAQARNEEHWAAQRKSLEQLRPRAFEALGLDHTNPKHRTKFDGYLDAVIRHERLDKLTPEAVMKAARCALEEIKDEAKASGANPPPPPARGFQPQLGAGGGKATGAANPRQWHADSFAEKFGLPRWGG